MLTIFWRIIKDRRISLIVYCLAGIGLLWMYIALFPSIQTQAASFNELLKNYPQALMKAFGLEELNLSRVENYLAMEQFSIIWPMMVIFLVVSLAGAAIAGEIEKGTAEIMLSKPVSRLKIFFGKYLAGVFTIIVFTICSIFAAIPLAKLYNIDFVFKNYVTLSIVSFFFSLAIFSLAMFFSAIFSEKSKAYMTTGGILIVMYVLNIIAALKDNLKSLKYLSFFYYYDPDQALIKNIINETGVLVFVIIAVVCAIVAAIWFKKRDIAV